MSGDQKFLRKAIKIASAGIYNGSGPFGAVITKKGKVIAQSDNRVILNTDPTAHAEIMAIREASATLGSHDLSGCVLYSSCEPCPMCLGAIYWSGIGKVVYASERTDAAAAGFNDKYIYDEISLDPSGRHIDFQKLEDTEAKEVFMRWNDYEGKVRY